MKKLFCIVLFVLFMLGSGTVFAGGKLIVFAGGLEDPKIINKYAVPDNFDLSAVDAERKIAVIKGKVVMLPLDATGLLLEDKHKSLVFYTFPSTQICFSPVGQDSEIDEYEFCYEYSKVLKAEEIFIFEKNKFVISEKDLICKHGTLGPYAITMDEENAIYLLSGVKILVMMKTWEIVEFNDRRFSIISVKVHETE